MSVSKSFKTTSRRKTWFQVVAFSAATLGTLGLAPAHADVLRKQMTVNYEDLDLTRDQDVKRLYTRLQGAARSVCSPVNGRMQYQRELFRQCFKETMDDAVNGVHAARLTSLHANADTLRAAQRP